MKAAFTAIIALAGAATVAAADFPANFPACAVSTTPRSWNNLHPHPYPWGTNNHKKTCGTNMLSKAAELGCKGDDIDCLCKKRDFGLGIHDCSVEYCGDLVSANKGISWGNNLCSGVSGAVAIPSATALTVSFLVPSPIMTEMSGSLTVNTGHWQRLWPFRHQRRRLWFRYLGLSFSV